MKRCPDPRCRAPAISCRLGEATPSDCGVWRAAAGDIPEGDQRDEPDFARLPWSGTALGIEDLAFLASRGNPKLVALIGSFNAGKSTLLGAFYQQVGRTGLVGDAPFAGSYSLEGWEAIAHGLRWGGGAPRFPPHTPSGSGRAPGLLHFAQRRPDGSLADHLFADTPGEWFQRWAADAAAPDAEGARWLVTRAAALLVLADCEALAGPSRGRARGDLVNLIRRVASARDKRPVALVWTKADIAVPVAIKDAVRAAVGLVMPDAVEFETTVVSFERDGVSVEPAALVEAVLGWAAAPIARGFDVPEGGSTSADPFFSLGARS